MKYRTCFTDTDRKPPCRKPRNATCRLGCSFFGVVSIRCFVYRYRIVSPLFFSIVSARFSLLSVSYRLRFLLIGIVSVTQVRFLLLSIVSITFLVFEYRVKLDYRLSISIFNTTAVETLVSVFVSLSRPAPETETSAGAVRLAGYMPIFSFSGCAFGCVSSRVGHKCGLLPDW